jgi:hypothetical protein
MSMTPEKATALRRPFPPESVGQLPKGGVMLDYVGHAAVTDRLLTVDPHWSWEPMALDEHGNPKPDDAGNLWIRLTICGITRIGVGDGKNMKERIGDALRNAAMRFGVALDLWAKENLVEFAHAAAGRPMPDAPPPVKDRPAERIKAAPPDDPFYDTPPQPKGARQISAAQLAKMHALFGDLNITDRDAKILYASDVVGRKLTSTNDLTTAEGRKVIDALQADLEQPFPAPPEPEAAP